MKSFFQSYNFFWKISVLAITIGVLTTLSVEAVATISVEDQIELNKHKVSSDDNMLELANKNKKIVTTGIALNAAALAMWCGPPYGSLTHPTCMAQTVLIVTQQKPEYDRSKNTAIKIQNAITDNIAGSSSFAEISTTSLEDLERDEIARESQRRALENAMVDQALDSYVDKQVRKTQRDLKELKDKGYDYNPKTGRLTVPDGKSIPIKDLSTDKGLKQLGLSDAEIKKFKEQQKKISKKAIRQGKATVANIIKKAKLKARRLISKKTDLGGGDLTSQGKDKTKKADQNQKARNQNAHNASSAGGSKWQAPDFQDITSQLGKNTKDVSSREFEGLSKNYRGGLIGVAEDNIFDMIHRRYLRKRSMFY